MLGEMLCMLAYIVYTKCCQGRCQGRCQGHPHAQVFQMLRGSIMIFVGIFSRIFLKKQLEWFRWMGMAVIFTGICIVGGADFLQESDLGSDAVIGDVICVCAQVIAACQFVYEEKFIAKYNSHPLKVVGSEGIFGFLALIL